MFGAVSTVAIISTEAECPRMNRVTLPPIVTLDWADWPTEGKSEEGGFEKLTDDRRASVALLFCFEPENLCFVTVRG